MLFPRLRKSLAASWPVLACAVAGVVVFQCYGNANHGYIDTASLFTWWVTQWLDPAAELQHAWILLALAVWIFRLNLQKHPVSDAQREARIQTAAVSAMAAALLLHGLGFQMQQARVSIIALLVFIWGVLALAGSARWARASLFPLGLMVFAIPFGFLDSTGFWMRLWVVDVSHALARLAHLEVIRSGTQLFSAKGGYQYDVAAACSGVRSLQALLALSLVAGYLQLRSPSGRIIVTLLSFPFVYLGNVVRVSAILFMASWHGQKAGERLHDLSGLLVFAIVLGATLAAIAVLKRLKPSWAAHDELESEVTHDDVSLGSAESEENVRSNGKRGSALLITGTALCVALWLGWLETHGSAPRCGVLLSADGLNPVALPAFIGNSWIGRYQEVSTVERELLPSDTGYSRRTYYSLDRPGTAVFVSVVLSGRDRSSIHRPELCLVGQGWSIESSSRHEFINPGRIGQLLPSTILHVRRHQPGAKLDVPEIVAYWFIGADAVLATQSERLWNDAFSRLAGKSQRWAYILVQTDARDGEAPALARIQSVLDGALPALLPSAPVHGSR